MPQVAAAIEALDAVHVAEVMADGGEVGINIDGDDHTLGADEVTLALQPLEGYEVEAEAGHAVALQLELDDELRREGLAREIVHAVQNARKEAGLEITDRIALSLGGDAELLEAAREHEAYLAGEVLATAIAYDGATATASASTAASSRSPSLAPRGTCPSPGGLAPTLKHGKRSAAQRPHGEGHRPYSGWASPMMKSVFAESENFTQQCSGAAPATSTSAASIRFAISAFCSSVRPSNQWTWTKGICSGA